MEFTFFQSPSNNWLLSANTTHTGTWYEFLIVLGNNSHLISWNRRLQGPEPKWMKRVYQNPNSKFVAVHLDSMIICLRMFGKHACCIYSFLHFFQAQHNGWCECDGMIVFMKLKSNYENLKPRFRHWVKWWNQKSKVWLQVCIRYGVPSSPSSYYCFN